ncbi:MAG: hypothetical protein J6W43_09255 [Prevotella sp.]|nr:hypothetical protein [Prevotella sp.]
MQKTLVILILIASAVYAGWWIFNAIRRASDPCCGCEGCQLKELKQHSKHCSKHKKPQCWHKK